MKWIENVYAYFAKQSWLFLLLILALFFGALQILQANDGYNALNPSSQNDHLFLQRVFSKEVFVDAVESWVPEGTVQADAELADRIQQYRLALLRFDFLFPIGYGALFMFPIAKLSRAFEGAKHKWAMRAFSLAPLAVLFDYVENSLHIIFLGGVSSFAELGNISPTLVALAASFSWLKWVCIALSTGYLLGLVIVGLGKWLRGRVNAQ